MKIITTATLAATLLATALPVGALPSRDDVTEVEPGMGEMSMPMPGNGETPEIGDVGNALRFEPIQSFDEMFMRDDVVFLMRHGPTDWANLDEKSVDPSDCDNQRMLSEEGRENMRDMGTLLALNEIRFSRIMVSEWCRNQDTLEALTAGYDRVEPGALGDTPTETWDQLNLLLSLNGARDVTELRERVSSWDGPEAGDGEGPLLLISHFTNIQELTEFSVYEGEILVLDPDRDNRVLGYLRLKTASPDVGHFDVSGGGDDD